MFEFVRENKKVMQIVLMLLILPSFVLVGVTQNAGPGADGVAEVGGRQITQQEWEEAQRKRLERDRAAQGPAFDPKALETPEAKQEVLDSLVVERTLNTEIQKSHVTIPQETLTKFYSTQFVGADGKFSVDLYRDAALRMGLTTKGLDQELARQLAVQQLADSIQNTAFAPRTVSSRIADVMMQEREVQELMLPLTAYVDQVKVTDAMVKAYYDKNSSLFQAPEQVKAEYVVFDSATVEKQISVTDAEVAKFYEDNKTKNFTVPEQRFARHILIEAPAGSSAADKAAAKARAEAVLAEVRAAPEKFAEIAKAKSNDTASAEQGGDLGVAKKGELISPALEKAIFEMKAGEISNVIESEFGYHIASVSKLEPATVKSLDEAKGDINAELKKQKMQKKYSELAELFNDTVYEQSDSLKPVADKLGLTVQTVENIARTPSPVLGDAPVNNAKFLKALFSDDSLKNKRNTEAVEVAPSVLVAGRVVEYKPAAKRPLAEVDAAIRQRVAAEEAARLAKAAGDAKLAAAKATGDATGFDVPKVISRSAPPGVHPAAAEAILKADVTKLPAYIGVDVPGMGYGVYRIGKVGQPAQPDMARRAALGEQLNAVLSQDEFYNYLEALKKKHKARITAPVAKADSK